MPDKKVNAVIIGAGAGGGIIAMELATAGLSVILLERGRWHTFNDYNNDELLSQRSNALTCPFGPDNEKYRRVVPDGKGNWHVVVPNDWAYGNNAGCVGGGTLSYGAMAWRFMPEDFTMKSAYGRVEGSTLEDWPLSYDDLEPFYEKAEYEIGVSGDHSMNPFSPARQKPYPMPPFPYNHEGRMLESSARRLGLHPFPIPMLRNSVFYHGRSPCIHNRSCVGHACPVNAKAGSQNTVIPAALKTGNCQLRSDCKVSEILIDEKGRATGVRYFDPQDKEKIQPADLVILCAGATETARLLLNSKSSLFLSGAANNSGWVGHNLQDHAYCGAVGLFDEEVYDDAGPGACIAINDFNHHNPGILGGGLLANEFIRQPYLFAGLRPPDHARWGKEHKAFQRNYFKKHISVLGPIQEMPVFTNQAVIDPVVRDYWGIPVLRISRVRHAKDLEGCEFLASKAEMWLRKTGAHTTWKIIAGKQAGVGQHQAGTCRMGNDPKTSVTNRYGQTHEIDNLFIADGSLHVTNGGFNPVLTIMALAYWVSDYIKKEWNGTRFK